MVLIRIQQFAGGVNVDSDVCCSCDFGVSDRRCAVRIQTAQRGSIQVYRQSTEYSFLSQVEQLNKVQLSRSLMAKVAHGRKYHCHSVFIGRGNHFFIPHGTTGLDDTTDADPGGVIHAIPKRKKCIGGHT